jgi:hypothetical protein
MLSYKVEEISLKLHSKFTLSYDGWSDQYRKYRGLSYIIMSMKSKTGNLKCRCLENGSASIT